MHEALHNANTNGHQRQADEEQQQGLLPTRVTTSSAQPSAAVKISLIMVTRVEMAKVVAS